MSEGLRRNEGSWAAPEAVDAVGRWGLLLAGLGIAGCAAGFLWDREQFFRSYLVAYLYWLGIALGCFAVGMLHHLSRGRWGLVVRRVLEAATRTLPAMFVLFLPLLAGLSELYLWARPEAMAADELLQHKQPYLNPGAFVGRLVLYFAVWVGIGWLLGRLSVAQDRTGDPRLERRLRTLSGPGLGLYALTATFASFDWLMSLDPYWYSTIYGVYFVGGHGLSAFAFIIVVGLFLAGREPMRRVFKPRHFHDYGKLMLAFVMLWAYFAYSQFLIIWSADLPGEITFYLDRISGSWRWVAIALVVAHFALPFVLLLSRDLKRHRKSLAAVALLLLAMRWVDLHWQVAPVFSPAGVTFHWLDLAALLAVGGLWVALFAWLLKRRPLLPLGDPQVQEALADA